MMRSFRRLNAHGAISSEDEKMPRRSLDGAMLETCRRREVYPRRMIRHQPPRQQAAVSSCGFARRSLRARPSEPITGVAQVPLFLISQEPDEVPVIRVLFQANSV